MWTKGILFFTIYFVKGIHCELSNLYFPDDFLFGTATSSYQIEGAWNEDGKGENIWDHLTHNHTHLIRDRSNGDIACDSYHKYKEDIALLKDLGVSVYRFSFSWSRIFPHGHPYKPNPAGIAHYVAFLDELAANNITAMATLFHWDLPQPLQELGGWTNPRIVPCFAEYAKVAFENFGSKVKYWITVNEPHQVCQEGYGSDNLAPVLNMSGIADYQCGHNLIKAHAIAYHIYNDTYRHLYNGKIGITIHGIWYEPQTPKDEETADRMMQFNFGWWAHPIFTSQGDYPAVMKEYIAKRSTLQGYKRSRLPEFTQEEIDSIKGTSDFLGLNHYTSYFVTDAKINNLDTHFSSDHQVQANAKISWGSAAAPWIKVVPWGFRKILNWLQNTYNPSEIHVTENGFSDHGGLNDTTRVSYFGQYLQNLNAAIVLDKVRVKSYAAWSLLDNFEWLDGYVNRFGMYDVDFSDPNRPRTPKASALFYKDVIRNRRVGEFVKVN
ncbi:myrosinase 1-like [Agrilus planipennis]|uniref:Myrosinase 1-like n=1 Tax=Agrilus planipennis TaxID=224129 RepID=A0A7F5R3M8_AGRPL|nr:myrosinase 1-like [Agrilus planipennis]